MRKRGKPIKQRYRRAPMSAAQVNNNHAPTGAQRKGMDETKLTAIEAWAKQAIAEYSAEIATGEPPYPQMAADVLELVREYRVLHSYSDMQAARLRKTINQPQQACPDCFGSGKETCQPEEPCNLCGGKGVV